MSRDETVETWRRLIRFHRAATLHMDRRLQVEFERSLDDYDVLHQVRHHDGPIRMGELTERLLIANSSCHRIVARLVDDGLLERTPGTDDRRQILVDLTPAGRRQLRRMAAVHTRDIERLLHDPLTAAQRRNLDRALRRLLEHAEQREES